MCLEMFLQDGIRGNLFEVWSSEYSIVNPGCEDSFHTWWLEACLYPARRIGTFISILVLFLGQ